MTLTVGAAAQIYEVLYLYQNSKHTPLMTRRTTASDEFRFQNGKTENGSADFQMQSQCCQLVLCRNKKTCWQAWLSYL